MAGTVVLTKANRLSDRVALACDRAAMIVEADQWWLTMLKRYRNTLRSANDNFRGTRPRPFLYATKPQCEQSGARIKGNSADR